MSLFMSLIFFPLGEIETFKKKLMVLITIALSFQRRRMVLIGSERTSARKRGLS